MTVSRAEGRRHRALKGIPALLPHEERQRIIRAPFESTARLFVTPHGFSMPWGGVFIKDAVPTDGRRVWVERPEDEEWMRNKWEEK